MAITCPLCAAPAEKKQPRRGYRCAERSESDVGACLMARRPLPPQEPDKGNAAKPRKAVGCPMGAGECADWRLWTGRPQSRDMSAR